MKDFLRAGLGCLLIPLYHIPRLAYQLLLVSYAYLFNRHDNLTADPKEHLQRARKHIHGQNSQLLYAALELRFALERLAQQEFILSTKATERVLDEPDPVKKVKALRRLDQETAYEHKIMFVNQAAGINLEWGKYKPLDQTKVAYIKGRLGDLLHPKDGPPLGIWDDPWYIETREFLLESVDYLSDVVKDNTPFFALKDLPNIEMHRVED
jgi:hypothetical protein